MSQRDTLQALDRDLVAAFKSAGLADDALYTAPGAPEPVECEIFVDREADFYGDDGSPIAGHRTLVTLFKHDVPAPVRNATVLVPAEGVTYTLAEIESRDQSMERWVVTHG